MSKESLNNFPITRVEINRVAINVHIARVHTFFPNYTYRYFLKNSLYIIVNHTTLIVYHFHLHSSANFANIWSLL